METDKPNYDNWRQNVTIPLLHHGKRVHSHGDECYDIVIAQSYKQARARSVLYNNRFNRNDGSIVFRLAYEVEN